ncbi:MAG: hypothetical protein IJJ26_05655, partial [Victivallales bacterium]|nr:hypothetical protein [Victivallales bacterium]
MSQSERITRLLTDLESLRARRRAELTAIAAGWLLLPCLLVPVLVSLLDDMVSLPTWGRWTCLCVVLVTWVLSGIWLWLFSRRRQSVETTALQVEAARPEARNCIINAVQFARKGECPAAFVEGVLSESRVNVGTVLPRELYSPKPLHYLKRALPILAVVCLLPFLFSPMGMLTAMARVFAPYASIEPWSATRILELTPQQAAVRRGQAMEVKVQLGGKIPSTAVLELEENGVETQEMEAKGEGAFAVQTRPLFASVRYRVKAGDVVSPWVGVHVAPLPGLVRWEAAVAPPKHTGYANYLLKSDMEKMEVMAGARMIFAGEASQPLRQLEVLQGKHSLGRVEVSGGKRFKVEAVLREEAPVQLKLVSTEEMEAVQPLPLVFLPDRPPTVALVDTPPVQILERGASFPVVFQATDDFGVMEVGIERLPDEGGQAEQVAEAAPEGGVRKAFAGRFLVDTATFDTANLAFLRFRVWADDNSPAHHRSYSTVIQVKFPTREEVAKAKAEARKATEEGLSSLIRKQRNNLRDTRQLHEISAQDKEFSRNRLEVVRTAQAGIREQAVTLLADGGALGGLRETLAGLVNGEMREVLEQFEKIFRAGKEERTSALAENVALQTKILAALTGISGGMAAEQGQQARSDVFAMLQKLIKDQRAALKDTEALASGLNIQVPALIHNQDNVAQGILTFTNLCLELSANGAGDEFHKLLRKAYQFITSANAYEQALEAAEDLEEKDWKAAITKQRAALKGLLQALDFLNKWRVDNAKKVVQDATETLKDVKEKLQDMEKKQAKIAEITRDLAKRGEIDDE